MRKITMKRFIEIVGMNYKSQFCISSMLYKNEGWMIDLDVSPFSGQDRYTVSFYKWIDNKKNHKYSGNFKVYKTKDYDEFLKFIKYIQNDLIKISFDEINNRITNIEIKKVA